MSVVIRLAFTLLCFIPFAAVSGQAPVITGTVSDSVTGQPIAGAEVQVLGGNDAVLASTTTGPDGRFRIALERAGSYTIVVRNVRYQPVRISGVQTGGAGARIVMARTAFLLEELIVETGSRIEQSTLDAPVAISVIPRSTITDRISSTATDPLIEVPGVNFARKGIIATSFNPRGSVTVFNGGTQFLTDYRYSRAPSLGTSNSGLLPFTSEDIERIEVLRGPAAALYGPNTAAGIVHIITRSPFESEGTTATVAGGERGYAQATFRHAQRIGEKVAFKISGEYMRADDWPYLDTARVANLAELGLFKAERILGEGRLDWRPDDLTQVILSGGMSQTSGVEPIAEVGRVKVDQWRLGYFQGRVQRGSFFANVMFNGSDAGNTLQLRRNEVFVDRSKLYAIQLQHSITLGETPVVYGVDARRTEPVTDGTIHGQFENLDTQSEFGAYLNVTHAFSRFVEVSGAIRTDYHDRLSDANFVFSPRAALILKPTENQSIRFTFNRAFDSPVPVDLFLDRVEGNLGGFYDVRAFGSPPGGLLFQRDCGPLLGGLCMRSPFTPGGLGGESQYLPADATLFWAGICPQALSAAVCGAIPAPTAAEVGSELRALNPFTGAFTTIDPTNVSDVPTREREITTAFEIGYKGLIEDRVWLTVDVYRNRITNRVGLPVVATPNVFFDRASLEAYLTPFIGAANAQAAAAGISGFSGDPANPGVPIGTISPGQIQTADLLIVDLQQNQAETRWGADIGITASVTPEFELRAGYAWVMVEEDDPEIDVNLPHHKGFLGATYRVPGTGLSLGARGRYVDGFDMQQGVLGRDRIDSYAVFDVNAAYQFPNSPFRLVLDAYNILDNEHQEIIASPKLGRLVITRIEARL